MKIALGLEYAGTKYSGWQRQKHARSIQQCLEEALSQVADQTITVQCAGRTDAGVHALHQVVHFETGAVREMRSWVLGGNVNLPQDVSILWAKPVPDEFHARFSATGRSYRYIILNRPARPGIYSHRVSWECRTLDERKMQQAAECLIGEHDFTSYRAVDCQSNTPVRRVRQLDVNRRGDKIIIDIEANAFLHHMVRNIAGVLMEIGMGKAPVEWSQQVLEAKDRTLGGVTAAPDGLYLVNVTYPGEFEIPEFKGTDFTLISC
jgi:tRNA pseudouridine38-40 synthase